MILIAMLLAGSAAHLPTEINERIEVDGKTYRVWVKGRVGKVYGKAAVVKMTIETRQQMLKAVVALTGCELTDPNWVGGHLEGVVECRSGSAG